MSKVRLKRRRRPEWIAVKTFAIAILAGTALLAFPFASRSGRWTHPVTALFTATSATCVTGLSVVDVHTTFSLPGELIILALMELGGLGVMTLGTFLLVLVGRRLSMQDESVLMGSLGHSRARTLRSLLRRTVCYTLLLEGAGSAILAARFAGRYGYEPVHALYHGVFHAVSAFCNAGLALYPDNLVRFAGDGVVLLTMASLIVLGGLGFPVLYNLTTIRFWNRDRLRRGRISLHSRIVLIATAGLILLGWGLLLALEWRGTLAQATIPVKLLDSFFQSVTPRTAGFNVVDMAAMHPASRLVTLVLMFVGGSPASTAGGIKTTTLMILLLTVVAIVRGHGELRMANRSIPLKAVSGALAVFFLAAVAVAGACWLLLLTERMGAYPPGLGNVEALLFEAVSAFGTVGLSMGVTPHLSTAGQLCIILCMFVGRLGPLTIAAIIGGREVRRLLRYPPEDVVVG